jgi:hypothetical protein
MIDFPTKRKKPASCEKQAFESFNWILFQLQKDAPSAMNALGP